MNQDSLQPNSPQWAKIRKWLSVLSTSKASSSSSTLGELRMPVLAVPRGSNGSTTTCSVPLISVRQNGHPCPSESCQHGIILWCSAEACKSMSTFYTVSQKNDTANCLLQLWGTSTDFDNFWQKCRFFETHCSYDNDDDDNDDNNGDYYWLA